MIRGLRVPVDRVAAMYADYCAEMSLSAVGRKYGRHAKSVRDLFIHRGFTVRPSGNAGKRRSAKGAFAPADAFTLGQIETMLAAATKIAIPNELRTEWRIWPLERRAAFVARLRARLASPSDAPQTPCSEGVEPFAYGSLRAHAIMADLNAGCSSHTFRVKMDLCTQGVIFRGRLWFWCQKVGYQSGPWTPEGGRPSLHRTLWEEYHGRPVPESHVVRHRDGNRNNFSRENLVLESRNDLARQNQASGLTRQSRELTAILLNRNQGQPNHDHANADTLTTLAQKRPAGRRRRV